MPSFARWLLVACAYAVTIACGSSGGQGGNTPGDAGSNAAVGNVGVGEGGTGAGEGAEAGEGGTNGSDLIPGVWGSVEWNEARWQ